MPRPVILIHGFAHTAGSWREVVDALERVRPGLDLHPRAAPGHPGGAPLGASWDQTVAALAATVAEVGRDALVVGYSLGARLALGLLAGDAVASALLIGVHPGLADPAARAARVAEDAAWAARLRGDGTAAFLDAWAARPLFAGAARAPADVRARRRAERATLAPEPLARVLEVLGLGAMPDLSGALLARAGRARLVVGGDDPRFVGLARGLRSRAPGLAVDEIAASGHDPTLEAPAALAAIVAAAV